MADREVPGVCTVHISLSPSAPSALREKVESALKSARKGVRGPAFYGSGSGWMADWEFLPELLPAVNDALEAFTAGGGGETSSIRIDIKPATWTEEEVNSP